MNILNNSRNNPFRSVGGNIILSPANTSTTTNRFRTLWQRYKSKTKVIQQIMHDYFAESVRNHRFKGWNFLGIKSPQIFFFPFRWVGDDVQNPQYLSLPLLHWHDRELSQFSPSPIFDIISQIHGFISYLILVLEIVLNWKHIYWCWCFWLIVFRRSIEMS